mgnify:CR=1 FL=1
MDEEHLNDEAARRYLHISLKREYASMNGTDFKNILPQMSLLTSNYLTMKQRVSQKVSAFVEKFKDVWEGFERRRSLLSNQPRLSVGANVSST